MNDEQLARTTAALRSAGCVFAEDEAQLLLDEAASPAELMTWTARRMGGEPLEQIVGWAEFDGQRVAVAPGVFVPRRRTRLLVALAVAADPSVVVDLCCGTGAIGSAVLRRLPTAEVWACDIDSDAVACARRNLPPERVREGDLYDALPDALRGRVDVLAVNAPYVPTDAIASMPREARDHEHRVALDGGGDGLNVQRRVVSGARAWLAPGGRLLVETGRREAELTAGLMSSAGITSTIEIDDELAATVVVGTA